MSKETKIGLAVIGVLLSVFSVLLVRHFMARNAPSPGSEMAATPVEPLSSAGMSAPKVVVASQDESGIRSSLWDTPSDRKPADVNAPATSYLPADDDGTEPADPYGHEPRQLVFDTETDQYDDAEAAVPSGGPFQNRTVQSAVATAGGSGPESAHDEGEMQPAVGSRNPLRQLSAEVPIDDDDHAAQASTPQFDLPADDRYARDDSPAATSDPFADYGTADEPDERQPAGDYAGGELADNEPLMDEPADAFSTGRDFDAMPGADFDRQQPVADPVADLSDRYQPAARPRQTPDADWSASSAPAAAPAAARPAQEPLPLENGRYTVQPGDTLWSISEKVYGTGGYFKALAAHNRADLPRSDRLTVGAQLAVPSTAELERDYPSLCPKQRKSVLVQPGSLPPAAAERRANRDVYIVAEGDTLFDIARYELGKASRWAEIYELNRDILGEDFDYLRPGTELVMPPTAETARRGESSRY